jgi:tRNA nucleotidyltransferase (CCA-adding enzyme)
MFLKKLHELPPVLSDFIGKAGALADEKGMPLYIVGGFVRDLFLGVPNFDVDLVIEGDGISFAAELARKFSLKMVAHRRFGTATLSGLDGFKVDIATSRRETYEKPGILPTVSSGRVEDDLFRRDFSINAMAISIGKHRFGEMVDSYGGWQDLKNRTVRALHEKSFMDDPTRILRAVRFEQRFDFKIEKTTLEDIKQAVCHRMLFLVQKHRLRDELILIFKEKTPYKSLRRLAALSGLAYVAPGLRLRKSWDRHFEDISRCVAWFDQHHGSKRRPEVYVMYLCLFFYDVPSRALEKAIHDFAFHKAESSRIMLFKENFRSAQKELSKKDIRPSVVYRCLEPLNTEVILLFMALSKSPRVVRHIEDFLFVHHGVRLHTRGEDLVKLGVRPGPVYKRVLQALLFAKIDGKVHNRDEELELAKKLLREK